jgi:hypothetical protein
MGLPVLTLDAALAATWRSILEENGLHVRLDQGEVEKQELLKEEYLIAEERHRGDVTPKWTGTPWVVANGNTEIAILEASLREQHDGGVSLIFMPTATNAERQVFMRVEELLIASGAVQGGP